MHYLHRTWFPFILVGLTLALGALIFVFYSNSEQDEYIAPTILTQDEYQAQVVELIAVFEQANDAQQVYDSLLEMHISEDQKIVHLDLILMFGKIVSGEVEYSDAQLNGLIAKYPWLGAK